MTFVGGGTFSFAQSVIQTSREIVETGKEYKSSFTYLGLSIDQTESYIIIN